MSAKKTDPKVQQIKIDVPTVYSPQLLSAKSAYGHALNSMAGKIDELLQGKGTTKAAMVEALVKGFGRDERQALSKVNGHLAYLPRVKGVQVYLYPGGFISTTVPGKAPKVEKPKKAEKVQAEKVQAEKVQVETEPAVLPSI